ncbi:MAG: antitoxin family protein [Planctomycetota bacterium]|nr:antitoxin family protein [Planctomycetota bacterium]
MSHVVDATYENGVLKLVRPLPLKDQEKVRVTVESLADVSAGLDAVRRTHGIVPWSGDADTLERMALDPEFDVMESP